MATAPSLARESRAAGILRRHDVTPVAAMPGLFHVRDTLTGSGTTYLADATSCSCYDAQRGHVCKHQLAVRKATTRLDAIPLADGVWDVCEEYTGTLHRVEGSRCSCGLAGDCMHLRAVRAAARDLLAYARQWDVDVAHDRIHCPKCGARLESDQAYIGGCGYVWLDVCRASDELHYSRRSSVGTFELNLPEC